MKYWGNCQNMTQRHEVSKCCWKNGVDRLVQHEIATDLPFVKKKPHYLQSTIKWGMPGMRHVTHEVCYFFPYVCISYIVLHNKLYQNLTVIPKQPFWGSIWKNILDFLPVVQWLRITCHCRGHSSIPGPGRFHVLHSN